MERISLYYLSRRLLTDEVFNTLRGRKVRIWSNEHRAYWGPNNRGYCDLPGASTYDFERAYEVTRHCGPEKQIAFELIEEQPGPYRAVKCPCGHVACKAWMVEPVAAVQGVSFTREQAEFVAAALTSQLKTSAPKDQHVERLTAALQTLVDAVKPTHRLSDAAGGCRFCMAIEAAERALDADAPARGPRSVTRGSMRNA